MGHSVAHKLIESHLTSGRMKPNEEIGLRIDQTLTQDATGTMVMLEFEAMQIDAVKTELSDSSSGRHRSIFIKSVTAFAMPIPEILEYAGSVFVISDERV